MQCTLRLIYRHSSHQIEQTLIHGTAMATGSWLDGNTQASEHFVLVCDYLMCWWILLLLHICTWNYISNRITTVNSFQVNHKYYTVVVTHRQFRWWYQANIHALFLKYVSTACVFSTLSLTHACTLSDPECQKRLYIWKLVRVFESPEHSPPPQNELLKISPPSSNVYKIHPPAAPFGYVVYYAPLTPIAKTNAMILIIYFLWNINIYLHMKTISTHCWRNIYN